MVAKIGFQRGAPTDGFGAGEIATDFDVCEEVFLTGRPIDWLNLSSVNLKEHRLARYLQ